MGVLKEALDRLGKNKINTPSRPGGDRAWSESQDWLAPEIYIAFTNGIDALSGDTPGVAECDVQIIRNNVLKNTGFVKRRVYNFGSDAVGAGYVPIMRDKYGSWIVVNPGTGLLRFPAILFDKRSYEINGPSDMSEGGVLVWDDPLTDASGGTCPPAFPPRLRGEYSWVQATEFAPATHDISFIGTDFDEDFGEIGVYVPKDGGFCGFAGECDAAREYNRYNGNLHLEKNIVEIIVGIVPVHIPCPEPSSGGSSGIAEDTVTITVRGKTVTVKRLKRRAWFNLGIAREDCSDRYMVTIANDNDTPIPSI